jgi:NADH-quinone oxidoreductase subunit D
MAEMWVNMGPQHPMTHGLWNLRIKIDGETITDAVPEIGYLHRGMEKFAETRTFEQFIPIADRLCYGASMSWEYIYVLTLEELLEVECALKAEYIRVITLEIQRIVSHLLWLAAYGPDLGNLTMLVYVTRDREIFLDILQKLTGSRMMYNYMRPGGVKNDLYDGFEKDIHKALDWIDKKILDYEGMLDENKLFLMRVQGVGRLKASDAMNLGVTGPNLRGSGVALDLRKHDPYSVYHELDWEIMTEKEGDSYARYRVRMNEMRESANIIRQALKKMPQGPLRNPAPKKAPKGTTGFRRSEDPRGESSFYIVSDGKTIPYRVKIRSPNFVNMSASPKMLIGNKVADVPVIMGSIDICMGETDR